MFSSGLNLYIFQHYEEAMEARAPQRGVPRHRRGRETPLHHQEWQGYKCKYSIEASLINKILRLSVY